TRSPNGCGKRPSVASAQIRRRCRCRGECTKGPSGNTWTIWPERFFERDEERGRRRSRATSRTSDEVAAEKRPAPEGRPHLWPSASLLLAHHAPAWRRSARLAAGSNLGSPDGSRIP